MHPKLKARGAWAGHQGELPVIEGTLIRLTVDHLPHDRAPKPVWLWTSRPAADPAEVNRCWQAFLRRFDIEHTFRFLKQVLGWTAPKLRDPAAADRWTWLILACYTQLWLARGLAADLRLPWQRPALPGRLTPARVRPGIPGHPRHTARSHSRTETRQTRPRQTRPARKTATQPPATTWARPPSRRRRRKPRTNPGG